MSIQTNIAHIQSRITAAALSAGRNPGDITLVAATKTQTSDTIRQAIAGGIAICGENRVQELSAHLDDYAYDGAQLHFIGHLQTNKVKAVVGRVDMIESVDSMRLLEAIAIQAQRLTIVQDVLLQVNLFHEASKGGCTRDEVPQLVDFAMSHPHLRLRGLMGIPPFDADENETADFFRQMGQLYVDIKTNLGDNNGEIDCLSMGMSGDFETAIHHGATLVRVGRGLFGQRQP